MHIIQMKLAGIYLLLFTSSLYVAVGSYVPTEQPLGVKYWTKRNAGSPTDIHCQDSKIVANPTANATYIKIITKRGDTLLTLEDSKPEFSAFDKLLKLRKFAYDPEEGVIQKGNDSSVFIIKRTYDRGVETDLVNSQNQTILNNSDERSSEGLMKTEVMCALLTGYGVTVDPNMDVNHLDRHNMTPILWATLFGQSDLIKSLVRQGANVNEAGLLVTPLLSAVASDDYGLVEFLVKHGANVNQPSGRPHRVVTPLHVAAFTGRLNITRLLLDHGADLSVRNPRFDRLAPLHYAVYGESLGVVKELASRGADVMVRTDTGKTPLHIAASLSNVELIHYLLQSGADVNAKDNGNLTPLMEPITDGTEEDALKTIQHLIHHHKPDVNAKDSKGRTALSIASARGFKKVYELLKTHGAE